MARIISIVNQKGGTGKSACTANLAVGLAQKNMKVLIVDADPQSDVSAGFGYRDCDDSNETLTALMDAVMKDEDIPSDCYIRHQAEGIDIICSNIGLAGTEVQLVNAMSREYVLKQILYGMDLAFGILEENEENADRVLDIQKYVNRQNKKCSKKKFMKVLETLVHAIGNDEGFIADMYACDKEAREIYLEEAMNAFNYVLDELCHGTGSAAGYDFNNIEE